MTYLKLKSRYFNVYGIPDSDIVIGKLKVLRGSNCVNFRKKNTT